MGDTQVDRRAVHRHPSLDDNRSRVNHLGRREIAQVKATIETGLTYTYRNTHVGGKGRGSQGGSQ
ncbi:MAG: hypothetical protein HGA96_07650 [Desulfobulbaceae bacterium]|nr:hypothetical protein [Desulfobulbaceae bacterium]